MFKKNKIFQFLSYLFILLAILLNLLTVIFQPRNLFFLEFGGWFSALLFIIGGFCIYKNKSIKNKLVEKVLKEYLSSISEEYEIIESNKQSDIYLVKIQEQLYNFLVVYDNNKLVVMKQIAEQDTSFYIKNNDGTSKIIETKFNFVWETPDLE